METLVNAMTTGILIFACCFCSALSHHNILWYYIIDWHGRNASFGFRILKASVAFEARGEMAT